MAEPQDTLPFDETDEEPTRLPARVERQLPALPTRYDRMGGPDDEVVSLRQYLEILSRRRWLVASVVVTVLVFAALQVFTTTPLYQATTTLQIDPEEAKILPYEEIAEGGGAQLAKEEYLWTQAEKLQTRSLARRVVERLELGESEIFNADPSTGVLVETARLGRRALSALVTPRRAGERSETELIDRFRESLQVRPLRNTRLIEVSYLSPDPEFSAQVANALAEEFIEQHLGSKFDSTVRATEFLQQQLDDLKIRFERSEEELLGYAKEKNIVNLSERETINRKKLTDLSDQVTAAEAELLSQRARYQAVQRASGDTFPDVLKNEAIRTLEQRLSAAEEDLAVLTSTYGSRWPAVKEANEKAVQLRSQLAAERRQVLQSARQEYELASDRFAKLSAALERQRSLVDRLDEDSIQYRILQREVETNRELYEGLLQRLKEAGVAAGLRSSNIRVADAASVPRFAHTPKKARSVALALVLGLFLGVGAAFLVDALDNTLKSSDDVADRLGLPSLGFVPHLAVEGAAHGARLLGRGKQLPKTPLLAFEKDPRHGRAWEAYRALRTSILLSHSGQPPQSILVTSALASEGKTTTAANTAIALAQTGKRTVIVDLDLRKPQVGPLFGVKSDEGMSTYLSGNTDLSSKIWQSRFTNLFVIPSGPPAPNPAELIGSQKMQRALQLLTEHFAYVVFDTPPALEVTDAVVLSPWVDGTILVARAGKTPREAVGRAAESILQVSGTLLGVLLNDAEQIGAGYGGYGYYGSGSYGEASARQRAGEPHPAPSPDSAARKA